MNTFTEHLIAEHRTIRAGLDALFDLSIRIDEGRLELLDEFRALLEALHFVVEQCHHGKEEEILFSRIFEKGFKERSGPQCTQFMQMRMDWDYVASLRNAALRKKVKFGLARELPYLNEVFEKNSMLTIPLEEHMAGGAAIRILADATRQTGEPLRPLAFEYLNLMTLHIRKEDECLFVLANELFDLHEQNEMLKEALIIESKLGLSRLAEARGRLWCRK